MQGWLGFVLAGFALAGSPGPATLSLAAAGAAFGGRLGLGYMAGIIAGMLAVMAITATGVTGMLMTVPGVTPVLAGVAALYFIYLAFRIATAPPLQERPQRGRPRFTAGVLLSLINPKGYAAMAALYSGFVLIQARAAADAALKTAILLAIILLVNLVWLFAGSGLTRYFRAPRSNRAINIGFALLLLASVGFATLR